MDKNSLQRSGIREVLVVVGWIVGVVFGLYALFALVGWFADDPLGWFPDRQEVVYEEPVDFQLCRDKGGIPIRSGWSGELKRCDF